MALEITVHGHSCDLALHPVSEKTAKRITEKGFDIYSDTPLEWWRRGKTATWGMKIDANCYVNTTLNGEPVEFDMAAITRDPLKLRRRMYLDSKARYICVLGFDNELCRFSWHWDDVDTFDPDHLQFMTHQWDRIMNESDYYILDEVLYEDKFADRHDLCEASGFTLLPPRIIDLNDVRKEWGLPVR
ncbi:hypothetical protein [Pseudodesulfovibrio senegalensis]|jgi:hypothetical protein|uniref:Uncharacterized protein n=1 Tax=Pseudodesulfovibrio senegalensis TaxID=1721087 RepID=A0A6N6N6T3_9BACT|nr:hypothetical protein [Pseudodesulfovibrio senegalensis]KAB1442817.1 hypothetical protein F8A88_00645 [Pseudodesulfovibrio senegalensis]